MTFDRPPTLDLPTLRKIARDTAARRAAQGGLLSAYLVGSVAANEPPLGNSADVDLILIHNEPRPGRPLYNSSPVEEPPVQEPLAEEPPVEEPPRLRISEKFPSHEIIPLNDAVVLDLTHHSPADYADSKALRVHPWRGPEMCEPIFLHDPTHFFERAQAGARGQFHRPDYVAARARAFVGWAKKEIGELGTSRVRGMGEAQMFAANAVISLIGFPASARKLMLKFDGAANRLGRPELYEAFMTALGRSVVNSDDVENFLPNWRSAYQAAGQFATNDPFIHPARLVYYASGFRAMLDADRPRALLWPLVMTWAAALDALAQHAPAESLAPHRERWREVVARLELDSPARLKATAEFVRQCELAVERWADVNGA